MHLKISTITNFYSFLKLDYFFSFGLLGASLAIRSFIFMPCDGWTRKRGWIWKNGNVPLDLTVIDLLKQFIEVEKSTLNRCGSFR